MGRDLRVRKRSNSRWPRADCGVGPALTAAARPPRALGNAENGWRVRWLGGRLGATR